MALRAVPKPEPKVKNLRSMKRTKMKRRKDPNRDRKFGWRAELMHEMKLRCLICGNSHVEAAHVKPRSQGGLAAHNLVPLCFRHHCESDGRIRVPNGKVGRSEFEKYYKINLGRAAHINEERLQEYLPSWMDEHWDEIRASLKQPNELPEDDPHRDR